MSTIAPLRLPRMLKITEVAEHLRLSTKTIRRFIKAGSLPVHFIGASGRILRVSEQDLRAFMAATSR